MSDATHQFVDGELVPIEETSEKVAEAQNLENLLEQEVEEEELCIVKDSSATKVGEKRVHRIIVGGVKEEVVFQIGEETVLPKTKAYKFLVEGFSVFDEKGNIITAPIKTPANIISEFGEDAVIAKLDELSKSALYLRACNKPGGEELSSKTSRAELLKFLRNASEASNKKKGERLDFEPMSSAELDAMGLTVD